MTVEDEIVENVQETEKHNSESVKKLRKFYVKDFRQELLSTDAYKAILNFVQLCGKENSAQDVALEYLENGGNCYEILRILEVSENKNISFVSPIIEALTVILLKIMSSCPQKLRSAENDCKDFLKKHFSIIKNMLGLNSSIQHRKIILKLLSTIVTLSSNLAKEILSQTFFDEALLKIVTNPSNPSNESSVRTSFIHFLMSFLIDGNSLSIISLIQKHGVLGSIFPGLIYDTPEVINLVLSTFQSNILINESISKTLKLTLFSNKSIHNIVNLFNWKGPHNVNKKNVTSVNVNQIEKQQVSAMLYEFLIILCASKHGICFIDPFLGLSNKQYNPIISQIIKNLHKPWTNVFVSDLIINICAFSPDIVKELHSELNESLETRVSQNWLSAVRFTQQLISKLEPSCVEKYLPNLKQKQIITFVQRICIPNCVTQVIAPETILHEHIGVRHESVSLLLTILTVISKYLTVINKLESIDHQQKHVINTFILEALEKKLPKASILLQDCQKTISESNTETENAIVPIPEINEHLITLIEVLSQYKSINPNLIAKLTKDINVLEFLETLKDVSKTNNEIFIKTVHLFISCDFAAFHPSNELFAYSFPLLLKLYFQLEGDLKIKTEAILIDLLNNAKIFQDSNDEILIWLYSILEQTSHSDSTGKFLMTVIKNTNKKFLKYVQQSRNIQECIASENVYSITNILENLMKDIINKTNIKSVPIFEKMLSPLILGYFNKLVKLNKTDFSEFTNIVIVNLLFSQTDPKLLCSICTQIEYIPFCNKNIIKYCKNVHNSSLDLQKIIKHNKDYTELHYYLKSNNAEFNLNCLNQNWRYYNSILFTNFVMYFYTQTILHGKLTETVHRNCLQVVLHIIKLEEGEKLQNCLRTILKHPVMLKKFSLKNLQTDETFCSEFVIQVITEVLQKLPKQELDIYLDNYRIISFNQISKILKDCEYNLFIPQLLNILKIVELKYEEICDILLLLSKTVWNKFITKNSTFIIEIFSFTLNNVLILDNIDPVSDQIIEDFAKIFEDLFNNYNEFNWQQVEQSLCNYIERFPHVIIYFSDTFFGNLLSKSKINKSSIQLIAIMMKCNEKFVAQFETQLETILDKKELVFALLNVLSVENSSTSSIFSKVYNEYTALIMKFLEKPQKIPNYLIENYAVIIKLINSNMEKEVCKTFFSKTHKFNVTEYYHFEVLTEIFHKSIIESEEDCSNLLSNYLITTMNLLLYAFKRVEKIEDEWIKIEKISKNLLIMLNKIISVHKVEFTNSNLYESATFQKFSKRSLKYGLDGKAFLLNNLRQIIELSKNENSDLGLLFEMALGHSESLNILLTNNNAKPSFIHLLLILCKKCPAVMSKKHVPLFLGAYEATLSQSDQFLLQLLIMYEKANIEMNDYLPFLWGQAAVGHYSLHLGEITNLWRQPKVKNVLALFNEEKIAKTVTNFPRLRALNPSETLYSDSDLDVYDPAFYLPLLSHILAPESTVIWFNIVNKGVINLIIICLTSHYSEVRKAALHALGKFYYHLETSRVMRVTLWRHFINAICSGMKISNTTKLSSIVAIFFCQCSTIFSKPLDVLYKPLGRYIASKEYHNVNVIPEFLELLQSRAETYKMRRYFILKIIRDGIYTDDDIKIMSYNMVFKFIMELYNSRATANDNECREIILEILAATFLIPKSFFLVTNCAFVSWLHSVLRKITTSDSKLLTLFINIVYNLVNISTNSYKFLYFMQIHYIILTLLTSMINTLKTTPVDIDSLYKYVKILYTVYKLKPQLIDQPQIRNLIDICSKFFNCNKYYYYLKFGNQFVSKPTLKSTESILECAYYLEMLTLLWIDSTKNVKEILSTN